MPGRGSRIDAPARRAAGGAPPRLGSGNQDSGGDPRVLSRVVRRLLARAHLPATISVSVDASNVGALERTILAWAVSEAIRRWNEVSRDVTWLRPAAPEERPDVLIRAHTRPHLFGYAAMFRSE